MRTCQTYAARMECSLNVPTYRAGVGRTVPAPASRPPHRLDDGEESGRSAAQHQGLVQ